MPSVVSISKLLLELKWKFCGQLNNGKEFVFVFLLFQSDDFTLNL